MSQLLEESTDPVKEIYEYWRSVMSVTQTTILTRHKRALIQTRLNDGFTVADMKKVIVNCRASDWNMGMNAHRILRNDIPFIFASCERVEMFLSQMVVRSGSGMTLEEEQSFKAIDRFVPPDEFHDH